MPSRAIIFDLDGTLADTRADLAASANHVRAVWGLERLSEAVVMEYVGDGARALLMRVLRHGGREVTAEDLEQAYSVFSAHYADHCLDRTELFPGIENLLVRMADRPLYVATNKPRAFTLRILDGLGVLGRFRRVVAGDDLEDRKPNPAHLLACLDGTTEAPAAATMVGDSANDIRPARVLGMRSIAVTWGLVSA